MLEQSRHRKVLLKCSTKCATQRMHLNHFNLRPLLTCFLPVWFYVITRYLLPRKEVAQRTTSSELIYPLIKTIGKGNWLHSLRRASPWYGTLPTQDKLFCLDPEGSVAADSLSAASKTGSKAASQVGSKADARGDSKAGPIPPLTPARRIFPKMKSRGDAGGAGDADAVEEIQRRMSWTSKFGDISTEYIFVAVNEQKQPGAAISVSGNGRKKFVQAEGAKEKQKQAEAEGLEPHPEADMTTTVEEDHAAEGALAPTLGAESADAQISPRPVPTGKLHRNMHILNSIVRTIGKTAAYMDVDDANESHFESSEHALERVLTIEDSNTGEVVLSPIPMQGGTREGQVLPNLPPMQHLRLPPEHGSVSNSSSGEMTQGAGGLERTQTPVAPLRNLIQSRSSAPA